jgi:hypothetical protein
LETTISGGLTSTVATTPYTIESANGAITVSSFDPQSQSLQTIPDLVKEILTHQKHLQGITSTSSDSGGVTDLINETVSTAVTPLGTRVGMIEENAKVNRAKIIALRADVGDVDAVFGQDAVLSNIVETNVNGIKDNKTKVDELQKQFTDVFTVEDGQPPIDLNKLTEILTLYEDSATDSVLSRISANETSLANLETQLLKITSILNTLTGRAP